MEASVRVARNGHGMGRVGEGWAYRALKTELKLRIEWVLSKGLGMNSGHGEVWIRVPVLCYTECNMYIRTDYCNKISDIPGVHSRRCGLQRTLKRTLIHTLLVGACVYVGCLG